MKRHRAVVCLVLLLAGSCAKQKDPRTEAKPSTPAVDKAGALIASAPAGQTLAALRARFTIERADAATSLDDSDTPKTWSPLLPAVAAKFAIADGGLAPVRRYLPQLINLVLNWTINPGTVFDLVLPLDRVAEGYRAMDERRAIKTLLRP